jgi:hypothetical protein
MGEGDRLRRRGASNERPDHWPPGVYQLSIDGMSLMGVHEDTGQLYWEGKEIVTKRVVSLRWYELTLLTLVAVGTIGYFFIELGRVLKWWV